MGRSKNIKAFMRLPQSSREWQNIQHFVGGLYNILLMITGVTFGKGDWFLSLIMGILTFTVNRISSEISYQTQKRFFAENRGCKEKKERPCLSGNCPYNFGTSPEDCTHPHGCTEDYEKI